MSDEAQGGNPPGVSDITPGGSSSGAGDLQKKLDTLLSEQKKWETEKGQYIEALNKLAERLPEPSEEAPPKEPDFDPETNEILERRVSSRITPLQAQLEAQSDMLDQMMFMNHAAAMGALPQQVAEAEQQYQGWRATGLRTVSVDPRTKRRIEKIPTRKEALAFVLGNGTMGSMLKEAPTKSMAALRAQLLGNAAFENPGGGLREMPQSGLNFDEVESKSLDERLKLREEALDKNGF